MIVTEWRTSGALKRKLDELAKTATGPQMARFTAETERVIREDNYQKVMNNVDGRGRAYRPPVRPADRTGVYKGATGPTLAPFGLHSRVITKFATARGRLAAGWVVTAGWKDLPFIIFHIEGRGHNPKRDPSGITPYGWGRLNKLFADFARRVANLRR